MEEGVRSGGSSEVVVKNRSSSGCLVVRRKGDVLAGPHVSSDTRKVYMSKKEKKRRMLLSDSGSSDEISGASRRRVGPETVRVCNDLTAYGKGGVEENEIGRKRERLDGIQRNGDRYFGNNGMDESEMKRSKLDVFDFNEYDIVDGGRRQNPYYDESCGAFGGRRFPGAMQMGRGSIEREFEAGSSRHVDKRSNMYFDRMGSTSRGGNHTGKIRVENKREGGSSLRNKFAGNSDQAIRLQGKNGVLKVLVNKKTGIGGPLEKYKFHKGEERLKAPRADDAVKKTVRNPFHQEEKIAEKPRSAVRPEKKHVNSRKSLPAKKSKSSNWDSEDSDTSLKPEPKNAVRSLKRASVEREDPPSCDKITPNKSKEGKLKRGSGTEKQKLRERIRVMLVDAGWTIDYRPRRNRDYLDAVYINPAGTAYWSIIKAYDALQKQVNEEDNEPKPTVDGSPVRLIADEDLCQLTRKTRKKMEKEMKMKQRYGNDGDNAKETRVRRSASRKHDSDSIDDSASHDEKLSSFIKHGGKSFKGRMNDNGFASPNSNGRNTEERQASGSSSQHGKKSRKLGRCTLLVRGSNKGQNSETDGFVPYSGKRTVLSWMIDSGAVQLSQKVQYKNRRRTRVMLEGWITRDGIHCGCCSKILTVSKFELHAASTLRQPYQNIYLDSGASLLQCQTDAWNRQEGSENAGFHSVDMDGDDPNDDTCGICGDGGDLICCDGCPSTFHQGCLDIKILPDGDWHCPNCTCKFCGIATETLAEEDDITSTLLSCGLCEKKYHESCVQDLDMSSVDSSGTDPSFCGQKCKELYEHLQRLLGVKHDLESGFSWSLIRRTDDDSKSAHRGTPQRVEGNSKLAVAMTVMDECFLPILDRRSGINLIRNVLCNSGSNFNRLNYTGFYTVILERGDEIVCAASIRFHGTKLAEMPFIGTRHIYRRQGMCRRLFSVIESVLCSLKVEKLVIPAISELTHTWTEVFGFTSLEEALKHEMRSMNMLVFPGIDMLQKVLGDQEHEANIAIVKSDAKKLDSEDEECCKPEVAVKPDIDSPTTGDPKECDDTNLNCANMKTEEVGAVESGFRGVDMKIDSDNLDSSVKLEIDSSIRTDLNHTEKALEEDVAVEFGTEVSDAKPDVSSPEPRIPNPVSPSGEDISGTTFDRDNVSPSKTRPDDVVTENNNKPSPDLILEDTVEPSVSSNLTPEPKNPDPVNNGNVVCFAVETTSDSKNPPSDDLAENNMLPDLVPEAVTSVSSNIYPEIENLESDHKAKNLTLAR